MYKVWYDATLLALETQQVIALRLFRLARGGRAADTEARRMMSEKAEAAIEAAATVMKGGSANAVIKGYRRRVRKNARRLTGGSARRR